jgi:hypothetical protein
MNNEYENLLFEEVYKKKPNFEIIKSLLDNGVNINAKNEYSETVLFKALDCLNDIKWKDENGDWAETTEGSIELVQANVPKLDITIIKYLLELGADPNIEDNDGGRCLIDAVYTFRSDIFELLLEYGVDINFRTPYESFYGWMIGELDVFKDEGNNIAVEEISKMVDMVNEPHITGVYSFLGIKATCHPQVLP